MLCCEHVQTPSSEKQKINNINSERIMKTNDELLEKVSCCTIEEDADLDVKENFYYKYNDVIAVMNMVRSEVNGADTGEKALHKQNVMPRFVYRLFERGQVRTYEIGECDTPRTYPEGWCDRRVCEGFWGDEEMAKKVVALLNGA